MYSAEVAYARLGAEGIEAYDKLLARCTGFWSLGVLAFIDLRPPN